MVVYDKLRNMEETVNDKCNTEKNGSHTEKTIHVQDTSYPQNSTGEDRDNIDKDETKQSCLYKPLSSSPMLRQRKKNISMFEVHPNAVPEITEIQQLCIETGMQQYVKESVTVLPELTSNQGDLPFLPTDFNTARPVTTTSEANVRHFTEIPSGSPGTSQDSYQNLRRVVIGKDNEWMGLGSKLDTSRIPSCPATPQVSPSNRRRSVGVLTTPAWGLRTYRDLDKSENKSWTSPSSRRRSLVLPVRHVKAKQSPSSFRKKSLVSPDVTELTTHKDCANYNQLSNSVQELRKPEEEFLLKNQEQQSDVGNENNSQDESERNINSRVTIETDSCSDDEFGEFRPRLRSRSLDEYRTEARKNVLQNRRLNLHETRSTQSRRKSFEVWLTDKEQETIKKLHLLTLERQREAEEEAKRNQLRKGKSYEEWLNEKNNMAPAREGDSASGKELRKGKSYEEWLNEKNNMALGKQDETTKLATQERQQVSRRRYDKWLMEKETQAMEKDREMLKQAKLKTIEMRKKYEERKRNKLNFLTRSLFS